MRQKTLSRLLEAQKRLEALKHQAICGYTILCREIAIDTSLSIIGGLIADIDRERSIPEIALHRAIDFAEQVLLSFAFPQADGSSPYADNLAALIRVLNDYQPISLAA